MKTIQEILSTPGKDFATLSKEEREIWRKAKEDEQKKQERDGEVEPAPIGVVQIPLFPSTVRAVPSIIPRTSLFGAGRVRTGKVSTEFVKVHSTKDVDVQHRGYELTQFHSMIWEELLHEHQNVPLGEYLTVSVNSILKGISRTTGKSDHAEVRAAINEMQHTNVKIRFPDKKRYVSLYMVEFYAYDEVHSVYKLRLNRELVSVFNGSGTTFLENKTRISIGAKQPIMAKLFRLYSSHGNGKGAKGVIIPYSVKWLYEHCGSQCARLTDFRRQLKVALEGLVTREKFLKSWVIDDNDLVHVCRNFG